MTRHSAEELGHLHAPGMTALPLHPQQTHPSLLETLIDDAELYFAGFVPGMYVFEEVVEVQVMKLRRCFVVAMKMSVAVLVLQTVAGQELLITWTAQT